MGGEGGGGGAAFLVQDPFISLTGGGGGGIEGRPLCWLRQRSFRRCQISAEENNAKPVWGSTGELARSVLAVFLRSDSFLLRSLAVSDRSPPFPRHHVVQEHCTRTKGDEGRDWEQIEERIGREALAKQDAVIYSA